MSKFSQALFIEKSILKALQTINTESTILCFNEIDDTIDFEDNDIRINSNLSLMSMDTDDQETTALMKSASYQPIKEDVEFRDDSKDEADKSKAKAILSADDAFNMARRSLVDLNLTGINEKIHEAASKGQTSIVLGEKDITGLQLLALSNLDYMITHYNVEGNSDTPALYKDRSITKFKIDWGFLSGAKS